MARFLWELASTGQATFPDGKVLVFSPDAWFDVVKFLYQHIDGPPKAEMDITSGGGPIAFREIIVELPPEESTGE